MNMNLRKWQPTSQVAAAAFMRMTKGIELLEHRKMFGYACVFANDHLCIGTHEAGIVIRLPEAQRSEFIAAHGASLFTPTPGRTMREYVVVPPAIYADEEALEKLARVSVDYVKSLPKKHRKSTTTQRKKAGR
jgi:TfoX/Sxy family transcriptional regulator of competence genes